MFICCPPTYSVHVILVVLLLTHPHKKSSPQGSVAQTADGNIQGAESPYHSTHLVELILVAERGFPQALPVGNFTVGPLCNWISIGGSCGAFFCCMALSASPIYHLTVEQFRQTCLERGLDSDGPVRTLRRRLAEQIKSEDM